MDVLQIAQLLFFAMPALREALAIVVMVLPRTLVDLILWQLLYLPLLLACMFPVVIQYERGGWWRLAFPFYAAAGILSAWLNYTTFVLYLWDVPRKRENTFSQRMERLVFDLGWRGGVARTIARFTNRYDPTPPHVPMPEVLA